MTDIDATAAPLPREEAQEAAADLYLVDGSGFIFRAFHALPMLTRPDGTPVNAVLGFTNMLMRLLADLKAQRVAVIFDAARRNFRNDFYPEYKAHRPPAPPELIPQFPLIHEAVRAFDLPCLELEGYEADDLIATYARLARESGCKVTVVSSDKDLMQLVGPGVSMLDPLKNRAIGPDEVMEKFGVAPEKVVDVQALCGDPVDNVPGVPGIGAKTAAQLIQEYGSLEALLERAHEIKQPKRRENLIEHAELARVSKRLVRLDDNVPVPVGIDDLRVHLPDPERLMGFLREQGFRSVLNRVEKLVHQADHRGTPGPAATPLPETAVPEYELITDAATLARWLDRARDSGTLGMRAVTDGGRAVTAPLIGVALALGPGRAAYLPLGHGAATAGELDLGGAGPRQVPLAEALALLKPVLEDPSVLKTGHDLRYDLQVFARHGIQVGPVDDSMLVSYVLATGSHPHDLDALAYRFFEVEPVAAKAVVGTGKSQVSLAAVAPDDALTFAAQRADLALRLGQTLKPGLLEQKLVTVYETMERPLVPVVAAMERAGILVDRATLKGLSDDFAARLSRLEQEVWAIAGEEFNLGSPKQLGEILFDKLGLPGGKRSKTGAYSTAHDVLEPLGPSFPIIGKLLDWRFLAKLKSTYTDALQDQIDPDTGRVHTSYAMAATSTGRLSSVEPNLQNIPIRNEQGREIRRAFVAPEGKLLLSVDYSQIELRLAAQMAGVTALAEAFRSDQDIHALTASQVFGVPMDRMTPEIRRRAKAINFGIIYGISGFGLAQQLGVPQGEAAAYIRQYLDRFWQIRDYMERTKEFCRQHGYVTTLFGRRCHIPAINDKNPAVRSGAERQAINAPLQGTAADIIKRAMIRIPPALEAARLDATMLLQVHDELVFEVAEGQVEETCALVKRVMEGAAQLDVPLIAEGGWARNWAEAH